MMEDKDWLKGLENKLKDYEEPAPEGLWEDIESSVLSGKRRRPVVIPVVWRCVAAAAVVALGVFAGVRLLGPGDGGSIDGPREALASGEPSSVIGDGSREPSVEIVNAEGSGSLIADSGRERTRRQVRETAVATPSRTDDETVPEVTVEESSPIVESRLPETEESSSQEETERSAGAETAVKKTVPVSEHDGEDWSGYISATNDRSASRGGKAATLDVSFSEGARSGGSEDSFDLQMFYRGSVPASAPGLLGDPADAPEDNGGLQTRSLDPMTMKNSSTVDTKSEHRRPVRVALTVNYPLGGVLGIETGATFTRLRSTFTTEVGRTVSESEQTLSYIGVPLNLTASFFDSRMFSVYVSGGGMAEKCVSGRTVTRDSMDGVLQGGDVRNNLNVKPLLWSLNASVGLQANLTRKFGVYVEPGVSYHFDDGSDVRTIYKDRPFDFALTFGARFLLR